MNEQTFIYKLIDPLTHEVKYVGKTIDPKRRQKQSTYSSYAYAVRRWALGLKDIGKQPVFEVIEACDYERGPMREKHWIKYFVEKGEPLLNYFGVHGKYRSNGVG